MLVSLTQTDAIACFSSDLRLVSIQHDEQGALGVLHDCQAVGRGDLHSMLGKNFVNVVTKRDVC